MPQIDTKNETVKKLAGLHLYHDPLSSCAMRVRLVLAEKHLPWQSHVIDLAKMEHATPEYQSINPSGLVASTGKHWSFYCPSALTYRRRPRRIRRQSGESAAFRSSDDLNQSVTVKRPSYSRL